jgi:uncharacterized protein
MKIDIDLKVLESFCKKWGITEFAVFGSVLRDDFRTDSDIDVLITFQENAEISLFDIVKIKHELESFFGRDVDVVEKKAIKNPYRRKNIFSNMEVLYAA